MSWSNVIILNPCCSQCISLWEAWCLQSIGVIRYALYWFPGTKEIPPSRFFHGPELKMWNWLPSIKKKSLQRLWTHFYFTYLSTTNILLNARICFLLLLLFSLSLSLPLFPLDQKAPSHRPRGNMQAVTFIVFDTWSRTKIITTDS